MLCLNAAIALSLLGPGCQPALAAQTTQRIEAERMQGAGHVVRDRRASGRRALVLSGKGSARASVRVRSRSRLAVVVRGDRCRGAPRLVVTIDGRRALSRRIGVPRYRTIVVRSRILKPGARHRIALRLANPKRARGCRRALRIDRLVLDPIPPSQTPPTETPGIWRPKPRTTWQWQLSGQVDQSVEAEMYDVDLFDTPASVVTELHAKGRRVICYFSAGSLEKGRPDARSVPAPAVGKQLEGWPDEGWLDIRRLDAIGPIMERRLDLCRQKGFDGVEADNVDAYANDSGFPLTAEDQLAYNRFLAKAAHARGLSIGLKNDVEQVAALEPDFDFAINEQCFQYDECDRLLPFVKAKKAVFVAEYELDTGAFCERARSLGFMAMRKRLDLDAWRQSCW